MHIVSSLEDINANICVNKNILIEFHIRFIDQTKRILSFPQIEHIFICLEFCHSIY